MSRHMTFKEALRVLMQAAERDVRGAGLGIRSTDDAWRDKVSAAWAIAWKHVYGWEPAHNDYANAGMREPTTGATP